MTATAPISTTTAASSTTGAGSSLSSLAGNFTDFLHLLMTQLQNQDPTAPMDTNQFTSQLVQYASVEQQINQNANLTKLLQATQSNMVLQSASLIGKEVEATSDHLALQDGAASVHFKTDKPQTVNIAVTSDSGVNLVQTTMQTTAGTNEWSWNGKDQHGATLPDGSYKVTVTDPSGGTIATSVTGEVTGMARTDTTVNVSIGGLTTDISNVQSVKNAS